jgi:hypothetical protein
MIFVVAGVPGDLFARFQQIITKIFGDGHLVVSKPLRPRFDGKYHPIGADGDRLVADLADRAERNPSILEGGCAVVVLSSPNVDVSECVARFKPFALPVVLTLPVPTLTVGGAGLRTMNVLADSMRRALPTLRKSIKIMNSELSSRRNRTPLLLPLRNFSSDILPNEVGALYSALGKTDTAAERIKAACARIEGLHPFTSRGGPSFYDKKGVRFKAPGRAIHGQKTVGGEGHLPSCLLNSRLRLGGHYESGFHYDCTMGERGALEGTFPNCHGAQCAKAGHPHLNIYTNDFIR